MIMKTGLAINRLSCYLAVFSIFKSGNDLLLHISVFIVSTIALKLPFKTSDSLFICYTREKMSVSLELVLALKL